MPPSGGWERVLDEPIHLGASADPINLDQIRELREHLHAIRGILLSREESARELELDEYLDAQTREVLDYYRELAGHAANLVFFLDSYVGLLEATYARLNALFVGLSTDLTAFRQEMER